MNSDPTPSPETPAASKPYASNPFVPALTVLGQTLKSNGIAYLQIGALILVTAIGGYLIFIFSIALMAASSLFLWLSLAVLLVSAYFVSRFAASLIRIWNASLDGTNQTWREAYAGTGKFVLRLIGLALLLALILVPAYLLLVIPGLFFTGRLALATPALVTEDLSIFGAIRRSWQLSRGHAVEVLAAIYAGTLMGSNGLVGFGVMPSSSYGRYRQLREASATEKIKVHWLNWLLAIVVPILITIVLSVYVSVIATAINNAQKNHLESPATQELYN